MNTQVRDDVRKAITDAYYDARNAGDTMETAADAAADAVMVLVGKVDQNARAYGWEVGNGQDPTDVLAVTDGNPFVEVQS
jgi:hypothetical protein